MIYLPNVFVSHASQDKDAVARLCDDLKRHGVDTWASFKDITPGQNWNNAIEQALEVASHVIVVASQASISSDYVRAEVEWALDNGKLVIPVLLEAVKLPLRWHTLQYIDLTPEDNRETLLAQLADQLPKGTKQRFRTLLAQSSSEDVKTFLHQHVDFLCAGLWTVNRVSPLDIVSRHEAIPSSVSREDLKKLNLDFSSHHADFLSIRRGTMYFLLLIYLLDHTQHPFTADGKPNTELTDCFSDVKSVMSNVTTHLSDYDNDYSGPVELNLTIIAGQRQHYDPPALQARLAMSRYPVHFPARDIHFLSYTGLTE